MVVDGSSEFVGSNFNKAISDIKAAASVPKAKITLSALKNEQRVTINGMVELPASLKKQELTLYAALVEDKLSSCVEAGENSGQTLEHSSVVQDLYNLGTFGVAKPINFEKVIDIGSAMKATDLRVVVFIQDKINLKIFGSAETRLANSTL